MPDPRPWKVTPLMLAAKGGQIQKVIQLLDSTDTLAKLIEAGAKINVANDRGEIALLLAERWQRYFCMILLIKKGASLWHDDNEGYSFSKRSGGFEWWDNADEAWRYIRDTMDNIGNH